MMENTKHHSSYNWWKKIKKFYTNNFPTDKKTSAVLLTLISTTLSLFNLIILTHYAFYVYFFQAFSIVLAFFSITGCANYFFYKGLLSDEWKQISLLITLKLIEITGCSGMFIYTFLRWLNWWYMGYWVVLILYPIFILLNALYTWCIFRKVKKMKRATNGNISVI